MAVVESRPARPGGGTVRASADLGERLRAAHPADGDLQHSPDRATTQTRLQRWTEQVKVLRLSYFYKSINTLHRATYQRFRRRGQQQTQAAQTLVLRPGRPGRTVPPVVAGCRGPTTLDLNSTPLHLLASTGKLIEPGIGVPQLVPILSVVEYQPRSFSA